MKIFPLKSALTLAALGLLPLTGLRPAAAGSWGNPVYSVTNKDYVSDGNNNGSLTGGDHYSMYGVVSYTKGSGDTGTYITIQAEMTVTYTWAPSNGDAPVSSQGYYVSALDFLGEVTGGNYYGDVALLAHQDGTPSGDPASAPAPWTASSGRRGRSTTSAQVTTRSPSRPSGRRRPSTRSRTTATCGGRRSRSGWRPVPPPRPDTDAGEQPRDAE